MNNAMHHDHTSVNKLLMIVIYEPTVGTAIHRLISYIM